jgi:hypothetical protein
MASPRNNPGRCPDSIRGVDPNFEDEKIIQRAIGSGKLGGATTGLDNRLSPACADLDATRGKECELDHAANINRPDQVANPRFHS